MPVSYRYEALEDGHVRLLELLPGPPQSPLECSLRALDLMNLVHADPLVDCQIRGKYESISYVWGDPNNTEETSCEGKSLQITVSLADALRRLRYVDKVRTLWADAICIDQKNHYEKINQLKLMGLIYWKSRVVNVWLGQDTESDVGLQAKAAIGLMRTIGDRHHEAVLADHAAKKRRPLGSEAVVDDHTAHLDWEATRRLLDRPWFKRAWTVQELGLAHEAMFYCGDANFSRRELYRFTDFIHTSGSSLRSFYHITTGSYEMVEHYYTCTRGSFRLDFGSNPKEAETFLQVLQRGRQLQCTNPRDSIYAFLGHPAAFKNDLLDSGPYEWYTSNFIRGTATLIEPKYPEENAVEQLYNELALAAIYKLGIGPELFCHVSHNEESIKSPNPSWVPQWSLANEAQAFYIRSSILFAASGTFPHSSFEVDSSDEGEGAFELRLKARFVDTITFTHALPHASEFAIQRNPYNSLDTNMSQSVLNPIEDLYTQYCNHRSTLPMSSWRHNGAMSFALTLTASMTQRDMPDESASIDPETHFENFSTYRREKARRWGPNFGQDQREHLDIYHGSAEQYLVDLERVAGQRSFFFTEEGLIGLGPRIMRDGDQVWLPLGAKMPCVLRPIEDGIYKILGQAYLHGIMSGEIVEECGEDDFDMIVLR